MLINRDSDDEQKGSSSLSDLGPSPLGYQEHNFSHERRSVNLLRRASRMSTPGHSGRPFNDVVRESARNDSDAPDWNSALGQTKVDKDELFFEHQSSRASGITAELGYLPYRAPLRGPEHAPEAVTVSRRLRTRRPPNHRGGVMTPRQCDRMMC